LDIVLIYAIAGLIVSFYIAWNLGANDASNPTDAAVSAGVLSVKRALILFAIFASLGAIVQGRMVMKTLGRGIVSSIDPLGAIVSSVSAGLWITLMTYFGMPISTSQSTASAVFGYGMLKILEGSATQVNVGVIYTILISWVTSPLISMGLTVLNYFLLKKLAMALHKRGYNVERFFKYFLIANICFSAYAFGANDVGNATGVYVTTISSLWGVPDEISMTFLAFLGALGIVAGGLTWGYRVIYTVAFRVTRLDIVSATAAKFANALNVWLFTTIPYILFGWGMPISTTHSSVASIIAAGIVSKGLKKGVNYKLVMYIVGAWVFTLPGAMGMSMALNFILKQILPH